MALSNKEKQDWARLLYCEMGLTQKAVAEKVGTTPKTMCDWVAKFNWDDLKATYGITKDKQLKHFYAQLNELNEAIQQREEGKRYPTAKEADALNKIASAARAMESKAGLSQIIDVFMNFTEWLRSADNAAAKQFVMLQDEYIKTKLSAS